MIPDSETLLANYDPEAAAVLEQLRPHLLTLKPSEAQAVLAEFVDRKWPTESARINNTHWIQTTKEVSGRRISGLVLLRWNKAQRALYALIQKLELEGRPVRIVCVKARQLGISAFIQSFFYDRVSHNPGANSMTVNYEEKVTDELFRKAHLIHSMLLGKLPSSRKSLDSILFDAPHNGGFFTKTARSIGAGRSMSYHYLHASELPLWPDPDRQLHGLQQSVPLRAGSVVIVESTAAGARGRFYEMWSDASSRDSDFVPFFAPWTWDDSYSLAFASKAEHRSFMRKMTPKDRRYQEAYSVTDEQMHWRSMKIRTDLLGNEDMFRQEFPITADEAFLTSGSPAFDPEWVGDLRLAVRPPLWTGDLVFTDVGGA